MNEQNLKTQLAELKSQAEDINQKIADVQAELSKPKGTMEPWVMDRGTKGRSIKLRNEHGELGGIALCLCDGPRMRSLTHPEAAEVAMQLLNAIRQQRGMEFKDDLYNPHPIHQSTDTYVKAGLYNASHALATLKMEATP